MKKFDIFMIVMLLLVAGILFWLLQVVKSEAGECIKEPFSYGATKWAEASPDHYVDGYIHIWGEGSMYFNKSGLFPGIRDEVNNNVPYSLGS